jgi:hypothetical protein
VDVDSEPLALEQNAASVSVRILTEGSSHYAIRAKAVARVKYKYQKAIMQHIIFFTITFTK